MLAPLLPVDEAHHRPRNNLQRCEEIEDRITRVQSHKWLHSRIIVIHIVTRHKVDLVLDLQCQRRGPDAREDGEKDGVAGLQAFP